MGQRKDEKEIFKIDFTSSQLDKVSKKMSEYDNEEAFLVGVRAIRYVTNPRYPVKIRTATRIDGLKGTPEPLTGFPFPSDIPLNLYRRLIDAVEERDRKQVYAEKKRLEYLEQVGMEL